MMENNEYTLRIATHELSGDMLPESESLQLALPACDRSDMTEEGRSRSINCIER